MNRSIVMSSFIDNHADAFRPLWRTSGSSAPGEYVYSVLAKTEGDDSFVYEAVGNYWDSGYDANGESIYTNGAYSLAYYGDHWVIISGVPTEDGYEFSAEAIDYASDSSLTGSYIYGSDVVPYGESMIPVITPSSATQSLTFTEEAQVSETYPNWFTITKNGHLESVNASNMPSGLSFSVNGSNVLSLGGTLAEAAGTKTTYLSGFGRNSFGRSRNPGVITITFNISAESQDGIDYPASTKDGSKSNPLYWDDIVDTSYGNRKHTMTFITTGGTHGGRDVKCVYIYLSGGVTYHIYEHSDNDTYLYLLDSSGSQLDENDDYESWDASEIDGVEPGSNNSFLSYRPSSSGFYIIAAAMYSDTGSVSLHVSPEPPSSSESSSTPTPTITLSQNSITVNGTVGTAITTIDLSQYVTVQPAGTTVAYSASNLPTGLTLTNAGILSGTPSASSSASISVTISATGAQSVTLTLVFSIASSGGGGGASYPASTQAGTLANPYYWDNILDSNYANRKHGGAIETNKGTIGEHQGYAVYVYLQSGVSYQLCVRAEFDTYAYLYDSSNNEISTNDDDSGWSIDGVGPQDGYNSRINYTPSVGGWYKMCACPLDNDNAGAVASILIDPAPAALADIPAGGQVTPTITLSTNSVTVTGTAGTAITAVDLSQYVTVSPNGTSLTYTGSNIPAGLTVTSAGILSGTPSAASSGSGTVTISASGATSQTLTLNFSITEAQSGGGTGISISGPIFEIDEAMWEVTNNQIGTYTATFAPTGGTSNGLPIYSGSGSDGKTLYLINITLDDDYWVISEQSDPSYPFEDLEETMWYCSGNSALTNNMHFVSSNNWQYDSGCTYVDLTLGGGV